jgi:hypothetical protein
MSEALTSTLGLKFVTPTDTDRPFASTPKSQRRLFKYWYLIAMLCRQNFTTEDGRWSATNLALRLIVDCFKKKNRKTFSNENFASKKKNKNIYSLVFEDKDHLLASHAKTLERGLGKLRRGVRHRERVVVCHVGLPADHSQLLYQPCLAKIGALDKVAHDRHWVVTIYHCCFLESRFGLGLQLVFQIAFVDEKRLSNKGQEVLIRLFVERNIVKLVCIFLVSLANLLFLGLFANLGSLNLLLSLGGFCKPTELIPKLVRDAWIRNRILARHFFSFFVSRSKYRNVVRNEKFSKQKTQRKNNSCFFMLIKVDQKHNRRLVSDIGTLQIGSAHCQIWTRESWTDIEFQTSWNRSRTKSKHRPRIVRIFL